ncbi:hypothetical protein AAFF_G00066240 [Aldrovandia affinis]|uniref:Ecto-5'-nucleotidase n=1 Tax=Aldrovandia affinis TaxID=143900 RepID=A0AAD7WY74_9TELE|nr:hypothetical protein AAFF_G00066240 [Aldrovandia affinis]
MTSQMNMPWFLSNVYDRFTSETLGHGTVSRVMQWNGLKIGLMGLVEEEWLDTLGTVDKVNLHYKDYVSVGSMLARELRSQGAELVIALTHMRWHNDVRLAAEATGIDLILGGHDHEYGVMEANGILIVKSGSEFRYLTKVDVFREPGAAFQYSTQKVPVERRLKEDPSIKKIVKEYNKNVEHMLEEVLCQTEVDLDGRCSTVRRSECNLGNLITNAMLEATHADVALLNSGTLRSDCVHAAGLLTMQDLLQILPMQDPVLVVEVTGQQLYEGLENSVRNYPALDGRFPQVAGIQFGFDPQGNPGCRVVEETIKVQGQNLDKDRKYLVAMKEYLAKGKDGYTMFSNCHQMFDIESAQTLSTIVINHFESGKTVRDLKPCRSGHGTSLTKASSSPSVSDVERTPRGKTAVVMTVPGVEGRIFHISRKSQTERER